MAEKKTKPEPEVEESNPGGIVWTEGDIVIHGFRDEDFNPAYQEKLRKTIMAAEEIDDEQREDLLEMLKEKNWEDLCLMMADSGIMLPSEYDED